MHENFKGGAITEVSFYILLATYKPNHGYGIMKFIEEETKGRVLIGAGTLYGAINNLLEKGWILPSDSSDENRKKQYIITPLGKDTIARELNRLIEMLELGKKIYEERYDE